MIDVDEILGSEALASGQRAIIRTPIRPNEAINNSNVNGTTLLLGGPGIEPCIKGAKTHHKSGSGSGANGLSLSKSHRNTKPVARSASILLRSKGLILSDSESDEEENGDNSPGLSLKSSLDKCYSKKQKIKKHKRKTDHELHQQQFSNPLQQCFGKRKRSATLSSTTGPDASDANNVTEWSNDLFQTQKMDCDLSYEGSSDLSESSIDSDQWNEADDEQSDFYEVISRTNKEPSTKRSQFKYNAIPIPKNPFAIVSANISSPSSSYNSGTSASNILWKRRRRNH